MLLRQVDRHLGLTKAIARWAGSGQDRTLLGEHVSSAHLRLALDYEDLNDHDVLRKDLLWQSAAERSEELASCSTLCRLENRAGLKEAWLMHQVLFEEFVNSFESAPSELILDFDCTDDRVHGLQEGPSLSRVLLRLLLLPLYVFCGEQLLVSYLRERTICAKGTSIRLSMPG